MDDEADRDHLRSMLRYARQAIVWATDAGPEWVQDDKTVAAIAMVVGQIGESAGRVSEESRARWRELPWQRMRGMRNVLFHTYGGLDVGILSTTVSDDLPSLARTIEALLAAQPGETGTSSPLDR